MAAAKYNINIEQGATFTLNCTMEDSAGTPVNLTGYTFSGKIRETIASPSHVAAFTFTLLNQGTSPGQFTVVLSSAITAAIPCNLRPNADRPLTQYFYDIEVLKTDSTTDRVFEGKAFVSPEVTR